MVKLNVSTHNEILSNVESYLQVRKMSAWVMNFANLTKVGNPYLVIKIVFARYCRAHLFGMSLRIKGTKF